MVTVTCPRCGKPDGSFACKVRHVSFAGGDLVTGDRAVDLSSSLNVDREDATIPFSEGRRIAREARRKKAADA